MPEVRYTYTIGDKKYEGAMIYRNKLGLKTCPRERAEAERQLVKLASLSMVYVKPRKEWNAVLIQGMSRGQRLFYTYIFLSGFILVAVFSYFWWTSGVSLASVIRSILY